MRRIAALWNSNWMGKVIASVVGLLVVCCIIGVVVRPGRRTPQDTANTFATIEARLATSEVAEPSDAPLPTEVPTASPEPTVALPLPRPSQDIAPIWADGDAGLKKDMSPLIERELALC